MKPLHHNTPVESSPWADDRLLHYYLMAKSKKYKHPTIGMAYGKECCRKHSLYTLDLGWTNANRIGTRSLTDFDKAWFQGWHRVRLHCFNSLTAFIYWELEDPKATISWLANMVNMVLSNPRVAVHLGHFDVQAWQHCQTLAQREALLRANHAYVRQQPDTYII